MHQTSFQFDQAPSDLPPELDLLHRYLLDRPKWTTASVIAVDLGMTDRQIRSLAAQSTQIVSGPGCPGYKHMRRTTPDEIKEAAGKLKSQGRKMWQRGQRLITSYHKSIHQNA